MSIKCPGMCSPEKEWIQEVSTSRDAPHTSACMCHYIAISTRSVQLQSGPVWQITPIQRVRVGGGGGGSVFSDAPQQMPAQVIGGCDQRDSDSTDQRGQRSSPDML